MPRNILDDSKIHPNIRSVIDDSYHEVVDGIFIGGAEDLQRLIDANELETLLG